MKKLKPQDVMALNSMTANLKIKGVTKEAFIGIIKLKTDLVTEAAKIEEHRKKIAEETKPDVEEGTTLTTDQEASWNAAFSPIWETYCATSIDLELPVLSDDDLFVIQSNNDLTVGEITYLATTFK